MCGIFGVFQKEPVDQELLKQGCREIAHRGPDHTGYYTDQGLGLGMNRLSIIDLEGGDQPMMSVSGEAVIVFNGEIYNYLELKRELAGHCSFRTNSDTEVILNGYLALGTGIVERLNGIFAFAIWDLRTRKLLLARDPVGVKPLFYLRQRDSLYFSSELKSFTKLGLASRASREGVLQFLAASYVFHPHTALENVYCLRPGEVMEVTQPNEIKSRNYCSIGFENAPKRLSEDQWFKEVGDRLQGSITRQMLSDVPVGLLLSSGLDSMYILATLHRHGYAGNLNTFTVYFDDPTFSENEAVQRATNFYGVDNQQIKLTGDMVGKHMPSICRTFDNLELLPTSVAMYFLSRLAGESNKVVLSGNGGDELLYGYPTFCATALRKMLGSVAGPISRLEPIARLFDLSPRYMSRREKVSRFLHGCSYPNELAHLRWRHILRWSEMTELIGRDFLGDSLENIMRPQLEYFVAAERLALQKLDQYAFVDFKTWLVDSGLMIWDKAGMASSLEIRVPFLDLEFLQTIVGVPYGLRARQAGRKWLLRKISEDFLPEEIRFLPKHGFQVPVGHWLKSDLARSFKDSSLSLPPEVFKRTVMEQKWREFVAGRNDHTLGLWCLGCLGMWLQQHNLSLT